MFLGYVILQREVEIDSSLVQAMMVWLKHTTIKELQHFLAFAHFYQWFIWNYSIIANPLTSHLWGKSKRLHWIDQARAALKHLQKSFTMAHSQTLWPNPFIATIDSYSCGIGAVLSQRYGDPGKLYPCSYFSHKLTLAEANYDLGNQKLLSIKDALKEWQHCLREHSTHSYYWRTIETLNIYTMLNAWILDKPDGHYFLYSFSFLWCIGQERRVENLELILPPSIVFAPIKWNLMEEIKQNQRTKPPPPACPPLEYVEEYVEVYAICAQSRTSCQLPTELLELLSIPRCPFSQMAVDLITDFSDLEGYNAILVAIDWFQGLQTGLIKRSSYNH